MELLATQKSWAETASAASGTAARRRATQVFVSNPAMQGTIQQMRRDMEAFQSTAGDEGPPPPPPPPQSSSSSLPPPPPPPSSSSGHPVPATPRRGSAAAAQENEMQELRGVFAAFDDDKDDFLTRRCVP